MAGAVRYVGEFTRRRVFSILGFLVRLRPLSMAYFLLHYGT